MHVLKRFTSSAPVALAFGMRSRDDLGFRIPPTYEVFSSSRSSLREGGEGPRKGFGFWSHLGQSGGWSGSGSLLPTGGIGIWSLLLGKWSKHTALWSVQLVDMVWAMAWAMFWFIRAG